MKTGDGASSFKVDIPTWRMSNGSVHVGYAENQNGHVLMVKGGGSRGSSNGMLGVLSSDTHTHTSVPQSNQRSAPSNSSTRFRNSATTSAAAEPSIAEGARGHRVTNQHPSPVNCLVLIRSKPQLSSCRCQLWNQCAVGHFLENICFTLYGDSLGTGKGRSPKIYAYIYIYIYIHGIRLVQVPNFDNHGMCIQPQPSVARALFWGRVAGLLGGPIHVSCSFEMGGGLAEVWGAVQERHSRDPYTIHLIIAL